MYVHLMNVLGDAKPFCGDTELPLMTDDIDQVTCGECFLLLMFDEEVSA